jgi:hypothetical protein
MITNGEEMIMFLLSRGSPHNRARHAVTTINPAPTKTKMGSVPKIPPSTQTSLWQRLTSHARQRWPQISQVRTRYRAGFAYVDAVLADGDELRLCRLRYGGSAHQWGFAIYRASHDDYEDSYLPSGYPVGTCEEALDTACGLYLNDPTAWDTNPRRTNGRDH